MDSATLRRGVCNGICRKYKADKPGQGLGRYEVGQARCQTCGIYITENGLNPPASNPHGELLYCKCCSMRVRKKPRQRESKERLQRNFVEEDTSQVPQADDLAKIMDIVGLVRDNENKLEQIAKKMHFTTRQSQYYCKAAEILGLIERIGSEGGSNLYVDSIGTGFHLTLHGISFLKKTIDERIDDLKNGINRIPIYKKFIDELKLKRNWSIEEIEQFFVKNAGLSNATAQRRSRTMIRWLFYLDLVEIRRKNVIFKDSNAKQLSMSDEINPQNNFILDEYQVSLVRDFYKVRKNWHGGVSDSNFLKYLEENGIFVDKYSAEWGSWEKFLGHATDTSIPNQVSMIIEYEKLKDDLDHIPTAFEMFKQGRYGLEPYKTEFGNWESFLRLVGDLEVTKDELVKEYAQEKELYGGSPTVPEMNDFGRYRYDDYVNAFGSWSAFLNYFEDKEDELDLEKTDSKTKIVNENAIIDDYNNLKAILLRTPTMEEIKDFGEYKIDDYVQIFGSYKLFLEKIGDLEKIDDQLEMELVKQYYELKESMGGQQPTAEELDTFGAYSLDDYKKVFGSWVGFQMHLEELERGERVTKLEKTTKEDLVSSYYRLKSKVGHIPSISELNQLGDYGHEFYKYKFGSYEHFLYLIEERKSRKVPESELIENYYSVKRLLGKTPTVTDMSKTGKYSPLIYTNRFGGWNKFLLQIGERISFKPGISKQDLIDNFNKVRGQLNHVPTYQEMGKYGNIPVTEYFDVFGSWNRFLASIGLETIQSQLVKEDVLVENYKKVKESIGRIPTESELRNMGHYSTSSYYDKYGSYDAFLVFMGEKENTTKTCERCGTRNTDKICVHCGQCLDRN